MKIERKESFPAEDGHIESILIGVDRAKISFQTWDAKKLVFIFDDVERVISSHSVYEDIGEFQVGSGENGVTKEVLSIEAAKMEIFQVGEDAETDSALFDVGYEYIGGQKGLM